MKIDEFNSLRTSTSDDIYEYIVAYIGDNFYGIGYNSISISRLITFLRKSIHYYLKYKYQMDLKVIITLPRIDEKLVIKDTYDDKVIRIRLSYDKIKAIVLGEYGDYAEYVSTIVDQLETELSSINRFSFIEYLTVQLDTLTDIACTELKSEFSIDELKKSIADNKCWVKLSQKSSVFNDYYNRYLENKDNKTLFYKFIKKLNRLIFQ